MRGLAPGLRPGVHIDGSLLECMPATYPISTNNSERVGYGDNMAGRPKGSRNRDKAEFDKKIDQALRRHGCDITELLALIATQQDPETKWSNAERLTAIRTIVDKRFPSKRANDNEHTGIPERIVITYDDSQRGKPVLAPVSTMGTEGQ